MSSGHSIYVPAEGAAPQDADAWVHVHNGHFVLHEKPFIVKGVNYVGSWRHKMTIEAGNGVEHFTIWALYHDFDERAVASDFDFIREQLNATAVRIPVPADVDFDPLVRYHGYAPWYGADGSVAEPYRSELLALSDLAYAHGLRIQLCLLWNLGSEIARDLNAFMPGGRMDLRYASQVRSIAKALAGHPGTFAFSIGNEVLVNWPINGTHRSSFEGIAADFMARRIADLRALAPHQLVTDDEGMHPDPGPWYSPGADFVVSLANPAAAHKIDTLTDLVDYLGPHFYPEILRPEDLNGKFTAKINDAKRQLTVYTEAAGTTHKPVVLNEFGLKIDPSVVLKGERTYGSFRDAYFTALVNAAKADGAQGLLAWDAIPTLSIMTQGNYRVNEINRNANSPFEIDGINGGRSEPRILFYSPTFNLFSLGGSNSVARSAAADAVAGF